MSGSQLENALDLIDANLLTNRDEVLRFIQTNPQSVADAVRGDGKLRVPTTAGIVTIDISEIVASQA
jgi:hypothetical protein